MLRQGDALGSYIILGPIAAGGMGVVYLARHVSLGHEVAIKVLVSNLALSQSIRSRFTQEARLQASLQHPNIVRVVDLIEGDLPAIVMDLVRGPSLAEVLEVSGPWSAERALAVMGPVISAVAMAHEAGVIHRDLKPGNILLDRVGDEEVPKVSDFGIAKILQSDLSITHTGTRMGTVPYMSPEQFRGHKELDARADVYALGVILWRLLVGRLPADPDDLMAVMSLYTGQTPFPPLPEGLCDARFESGLAAALSHAPDGRPADAARLLLALTGQAPAPSPLSSLTRESLARGLPAPQPSGPGASPGALHVGGPEIIRAAVGAAPADADARTALDGLAATAAPEPTPPPAELPTTIDGPEGPHGRGVRRPDRPPLPSPRQPEAGVDPGVEARERVTTRVDEGLTSAPAATPARRRPMTLALGGVLAALAAAALVGVWEPDADEREAAAIRYEVKPDAKTMREHLPPRLSPSERSQLYPMGDPLKSDDLNARGGQRQKDGDHNGALGDFLSAVHADPQRPWPRLNLAGELALIGREPEAISHLEALYQIDSPQSRAVLLRAEADKDLQPIWDNPAVGALLDEVSQSAKISLEDELDKPGCAGWSAANGAVLCTFHCETQRRPTTTSLIVQYPDRPTRRLDLPIHLEDKDPEAWGLALRQIGADLDALSIPPRWIPVFPLRPGAATPMAFGYTVTWQTSSALAHRFEIKGPSGATTSVEAGGEGWMGCEGVDYEQPVEAVAYLIARLGVVVIVGHYAGACCGELSGEADSWSGLGVAVVR